MLLRWLISAVSIYLVALLGIGVEVRNFWAALIAALVLGLANLLVRPILLLLTLPINVMTLGLFTLVVNGIVFLIAAAFTPGFQVRGVLAAILGALLTGIATAILSSLLGTK
jgi:putative membrane protein